MLILSELEQNKGYFYSNHKKCPFGRNVDIKRVMFKNRFTQRLKERRAGKDSSSWWTVYYKNKNLIDIFGQKRNLKKSSFLNVDIVGEMEKHFFFEYEIS